MQDIKAPAEMTQTEIIEEVARAERENGCADRARLNQLNLRFYSLTGKTVAEALNDIDAAAELGEKSEHGAPAQDAELMKLAAPYSGPIGSGSLFNSILEAWNRGKLEASLNAEPEFTEPARFVEGATYSMRSAFDQDCEWRLTVERRTPKTVFFKNGSKCRISVDPYDGGEYCRPIGSYSMAPILRAEERVA